MISEIKKIQEKKLIENNNNNKNQVNIFQRNSLGPNNSHNQYFHDQYQQNKNTNTQFSTFNSLFKRKFIEIPYSIQNSEAKHSVQKNQWYLLEKSQEMKNSKSELNSQKEFPAFESPQSISHSQLNSIKKASFQKPQKSLSEKSRESTQEHLNAFFSTAYFKKMNTLFQNKQDNNNSSMQLPQKQDSIAFLYEEGLKRKCKTYSTTVSLYVNKRLLVIPIQIKSINTVSYLLTLTFNFIEDRYGINPELLQIYQSNYVLYKPKDISHILQVRKESLISDIQANDFGEIGNFEVIYLDEQDQSEVLGKDCKEERDEEEDDDEYSYFTPELMKELPIVPEGYQIEPSLAELRGKTIEQLKHFKNFKIRNEYAEVCFEEEINLNRRDFSKEIIITQNEIILYPYRNPDEPIIKPGYGLNVQATIKNFNASSIFIQPNEKIDVQKIERCITKLAKDYNMEIIQPYNQINDTFAVRVLHF